MCEISGEVATSVSAHDDLAVTGRVHHAIVELQHLGAAVLVVDDGS